MAVAGRSPFPALPPRDGGGRGPEGRAGPESEAGRASRSAGKAGKAGRHWGHGAAKAESAGEWVVVVERGCTLRLDPEEARR